MNGPVLELLGVSVSRGSGAQSFRLDVPGLSLHPGDRLALLGPSGSGKSTLLELLALALAPDAAEVFRFTPRGRALNIAVAWRAGGGALDAWRARDVGYVLQNGGLLPFLTTADNIALPLDVCGMPRQGEVEGLASRLGIADQLRKKPGALSVGQRQRAAVARAVVHRPALVLADEPTAAVDPAMAGQVMELLMAEAAAADAALVVATHDHAMVERLGLPSLRFTVQRDQDTGTVARVVT